MLRRVVLHGKLAEVFRPEYNIDIATPAEAFRALCVIAPGFREHVEDNYYEVLREKEAIDLPDLHITLGDAETTLHIVPHIAGAKRKGVGKILLGGLLIAASFVIPGSWAIAGKAVSGMVAQAGLAMALGGISQMLSPQQDADYDDRDQPKSQILNGNLNISTPGAAIPVVVGVCEVGSVVVSGAIHVEDRTDV